MADYADTWFWQLFHHSADSLLLLGRAGFVDCNAGVESLFERLQDIDVQSDVWRWADTRVKRGEIIAVADTNASGVLNAATMGFVRQNNTRSFILLPMRSQGTTIGLIGFNAREPRATWTNESIQLLRIVGEIFVNALQRRQADDELRQRNRELAALSSRVVTLQESERQAVARELHDDTGQILTALALQPGDLSRRAGGMPEFLTHISELQSMVDTIATRIHRLASDLRPISLDRQSLVVALDDLLATFQRRSRIPVAFDSGDTVDQPLPAVVKTAIYRITQEALTNIARHAHASQVAVLLAQRHGRIRVIIEDNGVGFDTTAAQMRRRLGLLGMRERAEMLGGTLEIESRPGSGTTVFAEVLYAYENPDR